MQSNLRKCPYRITDCSRNSKKGIVASSYDDLIQQCNQRFEIFVNKVVLEDDGTEVDAIYFETLPQNCVLMILGHGQVWSKEVAPSTGQTTAHSDVNHRVMAMVEQIRKAESASTSRAANTNVTCTCGWQHFSYQFNKYVMVKNTKLHPNLGPRSISISRAASENDVLEILIGVFFPRGKSVKGRIESMDVQLGSYKGAAITDISATLRATKPHIYLQTKEKLPEVLSSASSDSDDLPDPEISPPVLTFMQQTDRAQSTSSQGHTMLTAQSSPPVLTFMQQTDRAQSTSSQGHTMVTDRTLQSASSQGLTMLTTQSSPQDLRMLTGRTQSSSQNHTVLPSSLQGYGYATPQRTATVVHSTPSNGSSGAPLVATLWNETGTPEVCIQSRKCSICYDREVTAFLAPCAHKLCMACCRRVQSMGQRCPLCRMEIASVGTLQANHGN